MKFYQKLIAPHPDLGVTNSQLASYEVLYTYIYYSDIG